MLQKYIGFLTAIPDFSYFSTSLIFMLCSGSFVVHIINRTTKARECLYSLEPHKLFPMNYRDAIACKTVCDWFSCETVTVVVAPVQD